MPTLSDAARPRRPAPVRPLALVARLPANGPTQRSCRVIALLLAITLMSLGDLYMTLAYLHAGGMGEANPLARWVMLHGSASMLICWKLLTVTVACAILFYARRTRSAEIAAWMCCLVLTWLTIHWHTYASEIDRMTPALTGVAEVESTKWVQMTP